MKTKATSGNPLKSSKNKGKKKPLDPVFDDSSLNNPETFKEHVEELNKKADPIPHAEILAQLIEKISPIDFRAHAGIEENDKLQNSHLQIISVEQILSLAKRNHWGICMSNDFIFLYNGAFWSVLDKDEMKVFLGDAAEKMSVDKFKAKQFNFRDQLFNQFLALANLPKPKPRKDVVFINFKNGTFEISPQRTILREFDRKDFIKYQLPFDYNPEALAPLFEAYLNRVQPDVERQMILAEYLAYLFISTDYLKLEKTLLLYGTGANGKSVFFEIVNALLGGDVNVSSYLLHSLTDGTGYYRAMLANKLVNYASEINGKLETAVFKQLVSGEPVEARLPYGDPFHVTNYAKLIFNCNELPRDVEQTHAYFRRFLIIPFDVTIPDAEQDKELHKKIIANELSGVFNWVLLGLIRLLANRNFTECKAVNLARDLYKTQSDSVKLFLEDGNYIANAATHKLIKEFYNEYRVFCTDDCYKPVSKTNFIKRLQGAGITVEKRNVGNVAFVSKSHVLF